MLTRSCFVENRSFSSSSLGGRDFVRAAAGRKRVVGAPLVAFGDPDTVGATPREKLFNGTTWPQGSGDNIRTCDGIKCTVPRTR